MEEDVNNNLSKLSMNDLFEPYKIKVIEMPKESRFHVPGLIEDIERRYGHFEVTDKGVALVKKK